MGALDVVKTIRCFLMLLIKGGFVFFAPSFYFGASVFSSVHLRNDAVIEN